MLLHDGKRKKRRVVAALSCPNFDGGFEITNFKPPLSLEPVWKCTAVCRGGVYFWALPKEHLNPMVRENEHPIAVLNPVVKKVLVWSGWGGLYWLLLLYELTSFDIIMIKISDVSYWNHSEHRGLTNGIRRNAKITKTELILVLRSFMFYM